MNTVLESNGAISNGFGTTRPTYGPSRLSLCERMKAVLLDGRASANCNSPPASSQDMATNVPMIHKQIFFRDDVKPSILLHKAKQQQQQHFVALANSLSSNSAAADAGSIQAISELLCDLRCTVLHICVSRAFFLCFSSRVLPAPISYTSSFTIAKCVFLPPLLFLQFFGEMLHNSLLKEPVDSCYRSQNLFRSVVLHLLTGLLSFFSFVFFWLSSASNPLVTFLQ